MIPTQRLPASLTPLDAALAALLRELEPVAPVELAARPRRCGCVAADMPPLSGASAARRRGRRRLGVARPRSGRRVVLFAAAAGDTAGLGRGRRSACRMAATAWSMPILVDQAGPMVQVLAEAIPGQGVRRAGGDIAEGSLRHRRRAARSAALDLLIARAAGLKRLTVRRPRLRIVNIPAGQARGNGALDRGKRARGRRRCHLHRGRGRDAASIAEALDAERAICLSPSAAAASAAPMRRSRRWPSAAR